MTAFWLQDPTVLFNNAGVTQIIPTSDMNREARLNAISRLIIVLSLLGYAFTLSYNVLLLGLISFRSHCSFKHRHRKKQKQTHTVIK